jgi:hypothetical protein
LKEKESPVCHILKEGAEFVTKATHNRPWSFCNELKLVPSCPLVSPARITSYPLETDHFKKHFVE